MSLVHRCVTHQVIDIDSAIPRSINEELYVFNIREIILQADLICVGHIRHYLVNEVVTVLLLILINALR